MLKKDVKNARSFSVVLDEQDALELREICEVTGMSATAIIKYAVHYCLPSMWVHVEAMKHGPSIPSDRQSDSQSDSQAEVLFEEILEKNFEITHDRSDFLTNAAMQRAFVEATKDDETYRGARLTFAEWKEFLRRRYTLEAIRSRSYDRKRGYVGIRLANTPNADLCIL